MNDQTCYHPNLTHDKCPGGHPIHYDDTGRYPRPEWVHCTIADLVTCPWEMTEMDPAGASGGYRGRHEGANLD